MGTQIARGRRYSVAILLVAMAAAMLVAGCGRRGSLEAPGADLGEPDPLFAPTPLEEAKSPGAQEPEVTVEPGAPERRFFLDPLI